MISKEYLEKFKEIYKKEFGKEISDEDALEQGTKLLRMVELIYKPMTVKEYESLQKHREQTGNE